MDEAGLRRTLNALADGQAPQPRFDIAQTMALGRRGRRRRQATIWGSALGAAAAVAVVISLIVAPRPVALQMPSGNSDVCANMTGSAPTASPSMTPDPAGTGAALAVPPAPLHLLTPCVSFGWLPSGYTSATLASGDYAQAQPQYIELTATGQGSLQLSVNAADACTQTSSVVNCGWLGPAGDVPLSHPAPAFDGRPAYWTPNCGMLWRYAPSAWAIVRGGCAKAAASVSWPPASVRPMLRQVAAGVRFTDSSPLVFPFWLAGIPAGWQQSLVQFAESGNARQAVTLSFGPASDPGALWLTVIPASDSVAVRDNISEACTGGGAWGQPERVSVDGGRATVWAMHQQGDDDQRLCADNIDGYAIWADVTGPQIARFGGVAGMVRQLHLLSTDPGNWTAGPLR